MDQECVNIFNQSLLEPFQDLFKSPGASMWPPRKPQVHHKLEETGEVTQACKRPGTCTITIIMI